MRKKKRTSKRKARSTKKPRFARIRAFLRYGFLSLLIAMVFSWMFVLPLRWIDPPTTAFILRDDSGRVPVLQQWTDWPALGSAAAIAVVAAEDQKFADHHGFDFMSIQKSVEAFNEGRQLRGASTLSQQVAKNLYLWSGRSFLRKGLEAYFTMLIEASLPKQRILEIYLNIAEFGPGVYGVPAASQFFYRKVPAQLSNAEAALLAAVLPNPAELNVARPSQYVRERQRWILQHMQRMQREQWLRRIN